MAAKTNKLSRREREIMDILYRLKQASAEDIRQEIKDELANPTVRMMLRILREKGHIDYRTEGNRYIYFPVVPVEEAQKSALKRVVQTFFQGSPNLTVAALLDMSSESLSEEDLDELAAAIEKAKRREGRS